MSRARKTYPSDLSDQEWKLIERYLRKPQPKGPKENVDLREVVNGINYWLHEGCQWRALPHDFPCWQTVYSYCRKWQRKGVWQQMHQVLGQDLRRKLGREETPSAAVIDSQSVKTGAKRGEVYGFDGGKKVKGRKRHIIVDAQGLLLAVIVTEANMSERLGALALLLELAGRLPRLALIWVDQGYQGPKFAHAAQQLAGVTIEVVSRQTKEFQVLPRRWVVERTFAGLNQNRRLIIDSELLPEVSESAIYVAMIRLMLRRLAKLQHSSA